jgi:hypothetical protein
VVRERCDWFVLACGAVGAALLVGVIAYGQPPQHGNGGPQDGSHPVYQRQGNDWRRKDHDRRRDNFGRQSQRMTPQVSSSWFQRPYPYHLDYYKMRYGGSYAPYYGNLYGTPFGTPQVVNGGWGPGYGGYPPQGVDGAAGNQAGYPPGMTSAPGEDANSTSQSNQADQSQQKSESLPAPVKYESK